MADSLPPDILDIPASVIEQIPLGVQIIDLDSLKASDRPTGQAIYPDSIIPVSSFTHGQHPDTGSAQTVQTDGNHALKVALAGGGPSSSPTPAKWRTQEVDNVILAGGWQDLFGVPAIPVLIVYGFDWDIRAPDNLPAGRGHGRFELQLYVPSTNFNRHHIVSRDFWYSAAPGEAYNLALSDTVPLSTPLDYGQSVEPVEDALYVAARSVGVDGWVVGFKLWYYDGSY